MNKTDGMITGCDEWLLDRYCELKTLYERLEDLTKLEPREAASQLNLIIDDVRLQMERAKAEYDAF